MGSNMDPNVEEALKAKAYSEKHFADRDFMGARNYALKAQMLCPQLEGISQMVATLGVYTASQVRMNGELDLYAILGLEPSADKGKIKKQYRKMAVLLHPDKNKSVGADGAFNLISEAFSILSDHVKRSMYDQRRSISSTRASGIGTFDNFLKAPLSHQRRDTFWTVCTSCHVQYEYLRKYVNKKLSCKNCRGVFVAAETGAPPADGSYQYSSWSYGPESGYGGRGCGSTYIPGTSIYCTSNGASGHHSGHGYEYGSNVIQWNSFPGTTDGGFELNGFSSSTNVTHQIHGNADRAKANGGHYSKEAKVDIDFNMHDGCREPPVSKPGRPAKKMKVDAGNTCLSGNGKVSMRNMVEMRVINGSGNLKQNARLGSPTETSVRRNSVGPAFDVRQLFINKARTDIRKKLREISNTLAAAETDKKSKALAVGKSSEASERSNSDGTNHQSELKRTLSMSITVPDSDFHDFDKDRTEECFKPKQIWALYDEEDGMPRLYCLIRQVISVKPFKIYISYLSSKTDSEFGLVNWLGSGFTKSCGSFRVFSSEIVEQVNIFSHLLSKEKAGRGGCVRIYPRSGDVWAVYRNWSGEWNRTTPDEERHQYEMVEVLDDYSEELGVCVTPLVKVDGYKTVYRRNCNQDGFKWIPRREMLRFSHQVPACLLKGEAFNLPEDCWDLDPAATPDELLQPVTQEQNESKPYEVGDPAAALVARCLPDTNVNEDSQLSQAEKSASSPDSLEQAEIKVQLSECCQAEHLTRSPVELHLIETDIPA